MSRAGSCYDSAVMERYFWSLKHEWISHESIAGLVDARLSMFQYIETFYNPLRPQQTLGDKSPNQREADHAVATGA